MIKNIVHFLGLIVCALCLLQCHSKNEKKKKKSQTCLSDTLESMLDFYIATEEEAEDKMDFSGKIEVDQSKMIKIYPFVGGIVEKVYVELGDYVKKGQRLAIVRSAEAAAIERDLVEDSANLAISIKNVKVSEDMYNSGLLTEKDMITAQYEYEKSKAQFDKTKQLFKIYNLQYNSKYIITSPIDGFVVNKDINAGSQLRSDNQNFVFLIGDLSTVWAVANIYETDIRKIKPDDPACIRATAYPDKMYKGKIDKIYNAIDPVTKVLRARINIDNQDYSLKPEMYVSVSINRKLNKKLIRIPSSAILFDKNKYFVVVYIDPCQIQIREINILNDNGPYTFVTGGIQQGEKVIVKNQLLVYNFLN